MRESDSCQDFTIVELMKETKQKCCCSCCRSRQKPKELSFSCQQCQKTLKMEEVCHCGECSTTVDPEYRICPHCLVSHHLAHKEIGLVKFISDSQAQELQQSLAEDSKKLAQQKGLCIAKITAAFDEMMTLHHQHRHKLQQLAKDRYLTEGIVKKESEGLSVQMDKAKNTVKQLLNSMLDI